MKVSAVFLLVIFGIVTFAHAQSKDQSINWIRTNLPKSVEQNERFSNLQVVDVNDCWLVLNWKSKDGDNVHMIYIPEFD